MNHEFQPQPPSDRHDPDRPSPCEGAVERAAVYLAGALSDVERIEFETELGTDAVLRDAVAHLSPAFEVLVDAVAADIDPPSDPDGADDDLRTLLAAIAGESAGAVTSNGVVHGDDQRSSHRNRHPDRHPDHAHDHGHRSAESVQIWRGWTGSVDMDGMVTLRANDGDWEPTGVSGVEVRRLFVDREGNRMTAMFRMAPGSAWPQHRHDGFEECYVISGDLHVGDDFVMRAGDFQRAHGGSHHPKQWTEGGCVILVSSSLHDELD